MSRHYRRPHTQSERRQNSDPQYREFVRGKRKNIVTSWDDLHRSDSGDRCWKRQRTTRWK